MRWKAILTGIENDVETSRSSNLIWLLSSSGEAGQAKPSQRPQASSFSEKKAAHFEVSKWDNFMVLLESWLLLLLLHFFLSLQMMTFSLTIMTGAGVWKVWNLLAAAANTEDWLVSFQLHLPAREALNFTDMTLFFKMSMHNELSLEVFQLHHLFTLLWREVVRILNTVSVWTLSKLKRKKAED